MKKFVFVIMPFKPEFNDIYQLGIKQACSDLDVYSERVDEQFYEGSMLERIHNQIEKADYIIADVSEKNPNVFYEVGYAFALEKKVVLITQNADDIPFDLKHYYHIIYKDNNLYELQQMLKSRINYYIQNDIMLKRDKINFVLPEFYVNGNKLIEGEKIDVQIGLKIQKTHSRGSELQGTLCISIYNPSSYEIMNFESSNCDVQFIYDQDFPLDTNFSSSSNDFIIADGKMVSSLHTFFQLQPKQWNGRNFFVSENSNNIKSNYECELDFILSGKVYVYQFNCILNIEMI